MKSLILIAAMLFAVVPVQARTLALKTTNTVNFVGQVSRSSVNQATRDLRDAIQARRNCATPIYLVLDTPGGSISAGNRFIEYAKTICNLHTVTMFAASMGSAIAMQLPGKRYVLSTGVFMFHRASVSLRGQISEGEVESRLAWVKAMVLQLETRNANRIGIPLTTYKSKVVNEWWSYGGNAVTENIADEVVDVRCSLKLQSVEIEKTVQTLFGPRSVTRSGCPLM